MSSMHGILAATVPGVSYQYHQRGFSGLVEGPWIRILAAVRLKNLEVAEWCHASVMIKSCAFCIYFFCRHVFSTCWIGKTRRVFLNDLPRSTDGIKVLFCSFWRWIRWANEAVRFGMTTQYLQFVLSDFQQANDYSEIENPLDSPARSLGTFDFFIDILQDNFGIFDRNIQNYIWHPRTSLEYIYMYMYMCVEYGNFSLYMFLCIWLSWIISIYPMPTSIYLCNDICVYIYTVYIYMSFMTTYPLYPYAHAVRYIEQVGCKILWHPESHTYILHPLFSTITTYAHKVY